MIRGIHISWFVRWWFALISKLDGLSISRQKGQIVDRRMDGCKVSEQRRKTWASYRTYFILNLVLMYVCGRIIMAIR